MPFAKVYGLLVQKAERKGRTRDEVDEVTCWLTGYDRAGIARQLERDVDDGAFFNEAPAYMKRIRQLDKLVDELAKGKPMEKILRG